VGDGIVFEPITVVRESPSLWTKATLDLGELARLRLVDGWTSKRLQAHFGLGRSKINLELRKLRKSEMVSLNVGGARKGLAIP